MIPATKARVFSRTPSCNAPPPPPSSCPAAVVASSPPAAACRRSAPRRRARLTKAPAGSASPLALARRKQSQGLSGRALRQGMAMAMPWHSCAPNVRRQKSRSNEH